MADLSFEFETPDPGDCAPYLERALDALSLQIAGRSELDDAEAEALIFAYRWLRLLRDDEHENQDLVQQQLSRVCVMLSKDDGEVICGDLR